MRSACIILLFLMNVVLLSQNRLRIIHAEGNVFSLFIGDSLINAIPQSEVLTQKLKKDTINIKVEFSDNKSSLKQTLFLLEKGKTVSGFEFIFRLTHNNSQLKLSYSACRPYKEVPQPIVPVKPIIDTSKKYNNNVLEHFVELKNGKISWFNNYPNDGRCQVPMSQNYINYFKQLMARAQTDDDIYLIAESTVRNNCINVNQLNLFLSYIPFEIEKLKLIRLAFFSLTDPENKNKLEESMKLEASKVELQDFFKNSNDYRYKTGSNCQKSSPESDIEDIKIKLKTFSSDIEKLNYLKKIYTYYCYNTVQIESILAVFIHDREKIEVAKLLYFQCTEKDNYSYISDVFSYQLSKSELMDFISKQKK